MFPIILHYEPITIYSLWLMLGLGLFVILLFINNLSKKRTVKINFIAQNSLLLFFSGLIGARLVFVAKNFQYFFGEFFLYHILEIFYIWDKGLSIWGALGGIFIVLFFLAKAQNANFAGWSDIILTSSLFGGFFFNIGTFLDGRNYGIPTNLPWGMVFEFSKFTIPIHPVQIYAAIYCLLLGILLFMLFNNEYLKSDGKISLIAICSYSIFRFIEEFLRGDEAFYFLFLREAQLFALAAISISGYFIYRTLKQNL